MNALFAAEAKRNHNLRRLAPGVVTLATSSALALRVARPRRVALRRRRL